MEEEQKVKESERIRPDLPLHLVHQILLAGPKDAGMTIGKTPSPGFEEFRDNFLHGACDASDQAFVVKRAIHDSLLDRIETEGGLSSMNDLLLELHQKLRRLVPNRKDLHQVLDDNRAIPSISEAHIFLSWIVEAGRALSMLESEMQSATTLSWIRLAERCLQEGQQSESIKRREQLSWMVCSLFFLIEKSDITQSEKDAFYFSCVVVPRLRADGKGLKMERDCMRSRFGSHLPITKAWILSLIQDAGQIELENLRTNSQARKLLIVKGWIETVLFQSLKEATIPEIFYLDVTTLRAIRNVSRLAAAGCALGLHAAHMAKCSSELLALQDESRGEALVGALRNREHHASQGTYEQSVLSVVVSLTQEFKGSPLTGEETLILEGQTKQVLSARDPVLQLLNDRMQTIFCELAVASIHGPSSNAIMSRDRDPNKVSSNFVDKAKPIFCARGLAFFATDLAEAAELASRVPILASDLYDNKIVEILEENAQLRFVD